LVAAANFLVAATKNVYAVPNFVAVPKPFFREPMARNLTLNDRNGVYSDAAAKRL